MTRRWIVIGTLLVLALLLRPVFHGVIMTFVVHPLEFVALGLVLYGAWRIRGQFQSLRLVSMSSGYYELKGDRLTWRAVSLYVVLLLTLGTGLGLESEFRLARTARTIEYTVRDHLPVFTPLRLTPKPVAERYAADTFQNPQEHLGDSQIVLVDGRLKRVFPRLPDGIILTLLKKLTGFVLVDVDTLDRTVSIEDQPFQIAEGIGIFDNLYYQLPLKRFLVDYSSEPIYLKDDQGQWITVVPYIRYRGFPFTVPEWGGVMIVHADGSMEDLTPVQAANRSDLAGNRLYPKELTHFYSASYAYRGGIINKWFLHRNETEIVSLEGEESIIHVPTDEGFKQLVVAEPYGRSYGIYRIFVFDASSGKREILEFDQNSQLTGPVAAADYIRKEFPSYDWSAFLLAEPRPVVHGQDLGWLFSVVPADAAGIATMAVLDAKTNQVFQAKTATDLMRILAGASLPSEEGLPKSGDSIVTEVQQRIETIQRELNALKELVK
ncbi:hypothetical protein HY524_02050 [Candidatus Berkelbacteria bacterium]|nr:hypothetical protein [Candidatus Berkelbacteria bacterium]